jgi:hypothetical protein
VRRIEVKAKAGKVRLVPMRPVKPSLTSLAGKGVPEEEGVLDVADVEDEEEAREEEMIEEQMFTFDKFEAVSVFQAYSRYET